MKSVPTTKITEKRRISSYVEVRMDPNKNVSRAMGLSFARWEKRSAKATPPVRSIIEMASGGCFLFRVRKKRRLLANMATTVAIQWGEICKKIPIPTPAKLECANISEIIDCLLATKKFPKKEVSMALSPPIRNARIINS
jgi:hypothetical protein